jgi:predicted MFS family arabinose efflux permease
MVIVAIIGVSGKLYSGPLADWVNNSLGGVFYVVFWCLFVFLLFTRGRPWIIAVCVLCVTCILEFMQLWHAPALESIRGTVLGKALIGSAFVWSDFPYYFIGSAIGWVLIGKLRILYHYNRL